MALCKSTSPRPARAKLSAGPAQAVVYGPVVFTVYLQVLPLKWVCPGRRPPEKEVPEQPLDFMSDEEDDEDKDEEKRCVYCFLTLPLFPLPPSPGTHTHWRTCQIKGVMVPAHSMLVYMGASGQAGSLNPVFSKKSQPEISCFENLKKI